MQNGKSGYSGRRTSIGTLGSEKSIISTNNVTDNESTMSIASTKVLKAAPKSSSGSSLSKGASDTNIQLSLDWYQTKGDIINILSTWYCTGSYDNANVYMVYTQSVSQNQTFVFYAGTYDDTKNYYKGIVVKYNSVYYKCTKTHTTPTLPTDTSYWSQTSMPDLTGVVANYDNAAWLPTDFDSLQRVVTSEGGLRRNVIGTAYEGCYVMLCGCTTTYNDETWDSEGNMVYLTKPFNFYRIDSTPTVSYNSSINRLNINNITENILMEFYRSGNYNPTEYSEQIRNRLYLSSILNTEKGYGNAYGSMGEIHRWRENTTYTVGITYYDSNNQSRIRNAVSSALSEINSIMSEFGIRFNLTSNTTGDITVYVGSHKKLFDFEASTENGWYNGYWNAYYDRNNEYIQSATVKLRNDGEWHCTYESVAVEELYQCLGCGYDQSEYPQNTLGCELPYLNKPDTITTNDADILRLLYSSYLTVGMNARDTAVAINPTNGAMIASHLQDLSFLEAGATYVIKIYDFDFVQDSKDSEYLWGKFSYPTQITVTIPSSDDNRPDDWEWTTNIAQGGDLPYSSDIGYYVVTATEWNNFTARINEFRQYKGLSNYSFTTAVRGNTFTAAIYNEAVNAIKGISGYGTYLSTANRGDNILASHFILLKNELNAIP